MLENPFYHDEESKAERGALRKLFLWFCAACGFALLLLAVTWPTKAHAGPVYQADVEGVKIVLTDEPCQIPAISNLQRRATWTEKGKTTEGCFGGHQQFPIVMLYFADKTVVVVPVQMFTQVRGA